SYSFGSSARRCAFGLANSAALSLASALSLWLALSSSATRASRFGISIVRSTAMVDASAGSSPSRALETVPSMSASGTPFDRQRAHRERAIDAQVVHRPERVPGDLGDAFQAARGADRAPGVKSVARQRGDQRDAHDGNDGLEKKIGGDTSEHGPLA